MSATDAKNDNLKTLARFNNKNGASSGDIPTLKSSNSAKNINSDTQTGDFLTNLTNPFQSEEKIGTDLELKPRFSEKQEIEKQDDANLEANKSQEIEKVAIKKEPLTYSEEQKQRKKEKLEEKDQKLIDSDRWLVRNGHALSFIGVFLFSVTVYFRPYTWVPGLKSFTSIALIIAVITLLIYVPSQLATEGTITKLTTEVKCILVLVVWSLLTLPIARDPATAWQTFNETFIKIVIMFIVMINTLRTPTRLRLMIMVSIGVGIFLSVQAWSNYFSGEFAIDGERVNVDYGGMFGNPNDMAIHLVIFTPIAVALGLASKKILPKILYFSFSILMIGGNMVTLSRGGFLGLIAGAVLMIWKLSKGQRFKVILLSVFFGFGIILFAPGNYGARILTIFDSNSDKTGSSNERKELLERSIVVTLRNPLGVGLGNFPIFGVRNLQTHNAYTQVSSELGWFCLVAYLIMLISPIRKLGAIERQLYDSNDRDWIYYLSIGIQAGIVGYMVSSFFASVAYLWYIYYPITYAVCLRRLYKIRQEQSIGKIDSVSSKNFLKLQEL